MSNNNCSKQNFVFDGTNAMEYMRICKQQDVESAKNSVLFNDWIDKHISYYCNRDGSVVISYTENKINNILTHKGYQAVIEFSVEDMLLFGKVLDIDDKIIFEIDDPAKTESIFHKVIDDYLEFCKENDKEPCKPLLINDKEEF